MSHLCFNSSTNHCTLQTSSAIIQCILYQTFSTQVRPVSFCKLKAWFLQDYFSCTACTGTNPGVLTMLTLFIIHTIQSRNQLFTCFYAIAYPLKIGMGILNLLCIWFKHTELDPLNQATLKLRFTNRQCWDSVVWAFEVLAIPPNSLIISSPRPGKFCNIARFLLWPQHWSFQPSQIPLLSEPFFAATQLYWFISSMHHKGDFTTSLGPWYSWRNVTLVHVQLILWKSLSSPATFMWCALQADALYWWLLITFYNAEVQKM